MTIRFSGAVAIIAFCFGTSMPAATLDFTGAQNGHQTPYVEDGLSFDIARIVSGNCGIAKGCAALNDNEVSVLTKVGGGTFSLTNFWYELLGKGSGGKKPTTNTLNVMSNLGGLLSFAADVVGHNDGGHVADLTMLPLFQNVTSLTFSTTNGGNVRLDDFGLSIPSTVPLPATAWMLFTGIAALAGIRRRKVV